MNAGLNSEILPHIQENKKMMLQKSLYFKTPYWVIGQLQKQENVSVSLFLDKSYSKRKNSPIEGEDFVLTHTNEPF